jgi:ABC-type phosphate/phosphonate transport system permease subunit
MRRKLLPTFKQLWESEWCYEFERKMRFRLIMGRFRYGALGSLNKLKYNRVKAMRAKLDQYEETGNTELLVDVANLTMCEFVEGDHPNKHFKSLEENQGVGIPGERR